MKRSERKVTRVALVLSIFLFSLISHAQFQAMRIPTGVFEFAGNVIGNIPASCINRELRVPTTSDYFTSVRGADITRIENGKAETRSLDSALGKWVRLRGTNGITEIALEPIVPDPNVKYRIAVRDSSTSIAASTPSSLPAAPFMSARLAAYQHLDAFSSELREIFGENSTAYRAWLAEFHAQAEWEIVAKPAVKAGSIANRAILEYQTEILKGSTPQETLKKLAVLKGGQLRTQEIQRLSLRLKQPLVGAHYGTAFTSGLQAYRDLRLRLISILGSEAHPLVRRLQLAVFDRYRFSGDITDAVETARKQFLPVDSAKLDNTAGARDLVGLWVGHDLSDSEVAAIRLVSGADVGKSSAKFQNAVLLRSSDKNLYITQKSGLRILSLEDANASQLKKILGDASHVLARDNLPADVIAHLAEADVAFVGNFDQILANPALPPKKPKIILVGSEDQETAKKLYGEDNIATLGKTISKLKTLGPDASIVATPEELSAAIAKLGPEEHALLIYHNEGNGGLFDDEIEIEDLPFDKITPISCDLRRLDLLRHTTTDVIDLERVIESLKDTMTATNGRKVDIDDFVFDFHDRYAKQTATAEHGKVIAVVAGVFGAAIVLYLVSDPCLYHPEGPNCKK